MYACMYVRMYICTVDLENFSVYKKLCKAHSYFNEIKHTRYFTIYDNFTFE